MIAFTIYGWPIYWYWLLYLVSFVCWYFYLRWVGSSRLVSDYPSLQKLLTVWLDDLMILLVVWVIIGGRMGEVVLYNWSYYLWHPDQILAIRNGGMSFVGGFIGVWLMMWFVKWWKKLSWKELFILYDSVVLFLPWWILLWRVGNGLNQELYGKIVDLSLFADYKQFLVTLASLDVVKIYDHVDNQWRRNTNLIEWLGEWVIIWLVLLWRFGSYFLSPKLLSTNKEKTVSPKKIYKPWLVTWRFCVIYALVRFLFEWLRDNPWSEYFYGILKSQLLMVGLLVLGVWLVRRTWKDKILQTTH